MIERNIPVDFLVYRPEEFEKRLAMGDPETRQGLVWLRLHSYRNGLLRRRGFTIPTNDPNKPFFP
jgi:hypothetical protein